MGDIDQFESVDVGAPFKLMQERSPMDVAIMKQIVRQKDLQLRGAVHDIIDNRIDAALQRIETQPADRVARSASASLPGVPFRKRRRLLTTSWLTGRTGRRRRGPVPSLSPS